MDLFKEHIRSVEDRLDSREPGDAVLDAIEARLAAAGETKRGRMVKFPIVKWAAAASVLVAAAISVLLVSRKEERRDRSLAVAETKQAPAVTQPQLPSPTEQSASSAPVPERRAHPAKAAREKRPVTGEQSEDAASPGEFTAMNTLITQQMDEIRSMPVYVSLASNFSGFKRDLAQLDRDEKDLRQRLKQHGPAPEDVEALINIYQQKIQVLKCLKSEVLKTGNHIRRAVVLDSAVHSNHA